MVKRPVILVIDDEAYIRDYLKTSLKGEGFDVIVSGDGWEGYQKATCLLPDVILMDTVLPDMDAYQVLSRLKAHQKTCNIPVIFLIAKVDVEEGVRGLESGAVDYITKPFYFREVIARIKIQLQLKEYKEELTRKNQELEQFSGLLLELNAKLEEMARKDELMQIWNRRAFNEQINQIHSFSVRYQRPYSIIIVDLDHFKSFNDLYGHQQGDEVLKKVAKTIEKTSRVTDFVARYGGEEIVVLLPETPQEPSVGIAERIIESIQELKIKHDDNEKLGVVTVSAGVSTFVPGQGDDESWEEVLKRADEALYVAKQTGRNRVCSK